jgi:hypothetical protein
MFGWADPIILLMSFTWNQYRHIWDMAVIFPYLVAPLAGFEPTTNSLEESGAVFLFEFYFQ